MTWLASGLMIFGVACLWEIWRASKVIQQAALQTNRLLIEIRDISREMEQEIHWSKYSKSARRPMVSGSDGESL